MGRRSNTPDYNRSSRIHTTKIKPTEEERSLTRKLIQASRAGVREANGQRLLNVICERLRLPLVRLRIQDTHQPHKKRSGRLAYKEYGAYYLDDHVIQIANLTAVRGKVVASKTFFDTLIHEFMHHLDRTLLRISSTPHSPGFYNRIDDLKRKLMGDGPLETEGNRNRWEPPPGGLMAALDRAAREARKSGNAMEPEPREKTNRAALPPGKPSLRRTESEGDNLLRARGKRNGADKISTGHAAAGTPSAETNPDPPDPAKQLSLNFE